MEHNHNHNFSSPDEIVAMTKYMISHNTSHIKELENLSSKLENNSAQEDFENAIKDFKKGCKNLSIALSKLEEE